MNIQKISLLLFVIITTSLFSMEKDAMEIEDNYCYIAKLPAEVTDLIGEYVGYAESDEDLIKRTRQSVTSKIVREEYHQLCPQYEDIEDNTKFFNAWCSDNLILAILKYVHNCGEQKPLKKAQLTIANPNQNKRLDSRLLDQQEYEHLAVSLGGHLFATVHQNQNGKILTIGNTLMNQKQQIIFPHDFVLNRDWMLPTIAFNKQTTKVIFHYTLSHETLNKCCSIVPISIQIPSDRLTSLGVYFAQKGVCKNLPKQLEYCREHVI